MSADPAGTVDGTNLFAYVRGSPVVMSDPSGTQSAADVERVRQSPQVSTHAEGGLVFIEPQSPLSSPSGSEPPPPPASTPRRPPSVGEISAQLDREGRVMEEKLDAPPPAVPEQGSEEGLASFTAGALYGDFSGNDSWSAIAGTVAVGLTPAGVVADVRDISAAGLGVWRGTPGSWFLLGAAAVGLIPGVGDAVKGALKKGKNAVAKGASEVVSYAERKLIKAFAKLPQAGELARLREAAGVAAAHLPGGEKFVFSKFESASGGHVFGASHEALIGGAGKNERAKAIQEWLKEYTGRKARGPILRHAEADAILKAFDAGLDLNGGKLFVDTPLCVGCDETIPKLLNILGVKEVTVFSPSVPKGVRYFARP